MTSEHCVPSEDGNEKEGEDTFEVKTEHVEAEDGHERVDDDAERCGHGVCSGRVEVALREMPDGWQPFYSSWDRALGCLKLVLRFDPSMQLPFGVDHVANPFFVMGSETVNDLLDLREKFFAEESRRQGRCMVLDVGAVWNMTANANELISTMSDRISARFVTSDSFGVRGRMLMESEADAEPRSCEKA